MVDHQLLSGTAGVGELHPAGEDAGRPGPGRLVRREPEVRGGAQKQGAPVLAAQGAGDDVQVTGIDLIEELAALADRRARLLAASATHTAPSASRVIPSGAQLHWAG